MIFVLFDDPITTKKAGRTYTGQTLEEVTKMEEAYGRPFLVVSEEVFNTSVPKPSEP